MYADATRLFREGGFETPRPLVVDHNEEAPNHDDKQILFCRTCGQPITRGRERMRMNGKHVHALFNPMGILFEVGCFFFAPGCRFEGELTHAFSWFPGYAWRFAFCRECSVHLGWEFRREADGFVGLIMTELRES